VITKEQARAQAEAHELAAVRNPRKAKEHRLAAFLLRKEHDITEPISFGHSTRNAEAQRAEAERIRNYTQNGVIEK